MDQSEKIENISKELADLKVEIRVGKNTFKIVATALAAILFIFFGITYANLGGVVDKAIVKLIEIEALKSATIEAQNAAAESIQKSNKARAEVIEVYSSAMDEIQSARSEIPEAVEEINKTFAKLDGYVGEANKRVRIIDQKLELIDSIIPNLEKLSIFGTAKHGDKIKVPWGTIGDWNLMVSPKYIGASGDETGDSNTVLLSADYYVKVVDKETWEVTSVSRHKFGLSIRTYPGEVNYLIIPKGRKKKVTN